MVAKCLDLNKLCSCRCEKKNEKIDMYDYPVHDYNQERNGTNRCLFQERLLRYRILLSW